VLSSWPAGRSENEIESRRLRTRNAGSAEEDIDARWRIGLGVEEE